MIRFYEPYSLGLFDCLCHQSGLNSFQLTVCSHPHFSHHSVCTSLSIYISVKRPHVGHCPFLGSVTICEPFTLIVIHFLWFGSMAIRPFHFFFSQYFFPPFRTETKPPFFLVKAPSTVFDLLSTTTSSGRCRGLNINSGVSEATAYCHVVCSIK